MRILMSSPVMVATSYVTAINNLKNILLTIGTALGAVMLVYGGIRFAMSFKDYDQNGEHRSVYTIIAGGILVGLSALVTALT